MLKRILAVVITCSLTFALSGCARLTCVPEQSSEDVREEKHWITSDIRGALDDAEKPSVKDDFHTAVNYDWLKNAGILPGRTMASKFSELEDEVMTAVKALLTDSTQQSHEAMLAREFYALACDIDTRNALGVEPVRPFADEIRAIATLDDLTEYLAKGAFPFDTALCIFAVSGDQLDSTKNVVYIAPQFLSLEDADEYKSPSARAGRLKEANRAYYTAFYTRLGYTREESDALYNAMLSLENELSQSMMGLSDMIQPDFQQRSYNPFDQAEVEALSPRFPLAAMLKQTGLSGSDMYVLIQPDWLKKLNDMYTEENIEGFKAMMLASLVNSAASYLDYECLNTIAKKEQAVDGTDGSVQLDELSYKLTSERLPIQIGRMYTESCFSEETKRDVKGIIEKIVGIYRARLMANDWLSESTREKAIRKLDNMALNVGCPDEWPDTSALEFKEEGTLLDAALAVYEYEEQRQAKDVNQPVDRSRWGMPPQTVNGFYDPSNNSINILAAILGGAYYTPGGSDEVNLAGIGVVIGHEITHAFDVNGSQFDENGNMVNWWTDEDRATFVERTDKAAAYLDTFEPLEGIHVNGQLNISEAVADLGGMSSALELARSIPDFDYRTFFETYVKVWPRQTTFEETERRLLTDTHPLGFLRSNVTVQQFMEFYEAFDIKPGDGMYLAPEDRLSVW